MWKNLGFGLGYRRQHFDEIQSQAHQPVDWFEIISENYMGLNERPAGRSLSLVEQLRRDYPLVMHGTAMSIGGTDDLDLGYLHKLKELIKRIEPEWVSDHLCWTGVDGRTMHDLLPLPHTHEAIDHMVARIHQVQDFLGHTLVFENVSSYLEYTSSEMTEWEFIGEICQRTGCGLLLDVNNVYVSSVNHGFDPFEYIRHIPARSVAYIHLAGHSRNGRHLIDTHDHPVAPEVWDLYQKTVSMIGPRSTMIERDDNIPSYIELANELSLARRRGICELSIAP